MVHFILHYNVFIALCASAMTFETSLLAGNKQTDWPLMSLQFFATLFAYNFYYLKSRHHRWSRYFCILSAPPALLSFFLSASVNIPALLFVCLFALLYTLPGLWEYRYSPFEKIGRLLLLSLTWTLATYSLNTDSQLIPNNQTALFLYRLLLLWNLCLVFFIRDEAQHFKPGLLQKVLWTGIFCQGLFAAGILYWYDAGIGAAFLTACLIQLFVSVPLARRRYSNHHYLWWIDGIMPAQTIFVFLVQQRHLF